MIVVHANLDCEARWAGVQLPARVLRKISALAALTAALVDDETAANSTAHAIEDATATNPTGHAGDADRTSVEVWAPAAVDPSRLLDSPAWRRPAMRVGTPPAAAIAWADPAAKPHNDRRFALAVADAAGIDMCGARVVSTLDELAGVSGPWVCKAPWTTAGRDRCRGDGPPSAEQRVHLARMVERSSATGSTLGALMFEPWLDRLVDIGTCARVTTTGAVVVIEEPHTLLVDARGGFAGIDLAPPAVETHEREAIVAAVRVAGEALARAGYVGPFAVDSFIYRAGGERRVRAIVEINARHTFGHVARALGSRGIGARRLGFTTPPPEHATVLVAPTADDPTTAWIV